MNLEIKTADNGFVTTDDDGVTRVYNTPGELMAWVYRNLPGTCVSDRHAEVRELIEILFVEEQKQADGREESQACDNLFVRKQPQADGQENAFSQYLVGMNLPGCIFVGNPDSACYPTSSATMAASLDHKGALRVLRRFPHIKAFRLIPVDLKAVGTGTPS